MGDIQQKVREGETVGEDLAILSKMIEECAQDAREIQMDLRPPMLDDLGILPTLSWFCRRFETTYPNIHVDCQLDIQGNVVPKTLGTVIYRIIQEAFNNITKHATATLIKFTIQKIDARIELTIQDNGKGFDRETVLSRESSERGLGLTSMRERAELSGGVFHVESAIGKGTVVRVSWPIE
jgi:signal transduction histidine kinase